MKAIFKVTGEFKTMHGVDNRLIYVADQAEDAEEFCSNYSREAKEKDLEFLAIALRIEKIWVRED